MSRIIFVNRYYAPDLSGTAQLLTDLAEDLALEKRELLIYTSRYQHDDASTRFARAETMDWVEVRRLSHFRFGPAALRNFSFYVGVWLRLLFSLRRGDVVVLTTDPPYLPLWLWPVIRLRGAGLVNWLLALHPEMGKRQGVLKAEWKVGLLTRLRNLALRQADSNVVMADGMVDRIGRASGNPDGVAVIANWANEKVIHPIEHEDNELRAQWGLDHSFVIGYCGHLDEEHPLNAFHQLIDHFHNVPGVRFLFVGGGTGLERLRTLCQGKHYTHVTILGYQPRGLLARTLSVPDLHLACQAKVLDGLAVPSKLCSIMAAGRPTLFLGKPHGEVAHILEEFGCGTVVDPNLDGVVASVEMMWRRPKLRLAMGMRARQAFEGNFNRATATLSWMSLLDGIHLAREKPGER